MNEAAIGLSTICAASICLISLSSSWLYRKESQITSELMSLVSFLPGFIYASVALLSSPFGVSGNTLIALIVKNVLYCSSFYFRYESLRKFGPFVGALMLGTQPILIFLLGFVLLGEQLMLIQIASVVLAALSLLLLTGKNSHTQERMRAGDFAKFYAFPLLASALAMVWDRYFLRGKISAEEFFILDRLVVLPTFLFVVVLIKRFDLRLSGYSVSVLQRNWKVLVIIGFLFTLSVYTYNLALELEKVALVGLFRNAAYPVAAFAGAFLFKQKVSVKEWLSLALILLAVSFGILS